MFTIAEKTEVRRLVEAGISARYALRMIEGVLPSSTTEMTRPALVATLHPLLETVEGASNALSFLSGGIAVRGDDEKVVAREWPRAHFLERAYHDLDEAIHEADEAFEHLSRLGAVVAHDNIQIARTHLSRAKSRMINFNRKLPFANPNAYEAAGVDLILQRDVMTNLYRCSGQYLYDGLEAVLESYASDPPILQQEFLLLMKDALWLGWLIQDDLAKQTARCLGIEWVPGENPIETAFWDTIADTAPRFQFCLTNIALMLAAEPVLNRPHLQECYIFASRKIADGWKRMDYFIGLLPVMGKWMRPRQPFGTRRMDAFQSPELQD